MIFNLNAYSEALATLAKKNTGYTGCKPMVSVSGKLVKRKQNFLRVYYHEDEKRSLAPIFYVSGEGAGGGGGGMGSIFSSHLI